MKITRDSQQLIRSTSDNAVDTVGLMPVKDLIKQQKTNSAVTTTRSERKTDTVQISKMGAELSSASSTDIDSMKPSMDKRSEVKRISSGGIESVMARYKEAQNFMAQIESESINSTA
jgi:hypothetical protein